MAVAAPDIYQQKVVLCIPLLPTQMPHPELDVCWSADGGRRGVASGPVIRRHKGVCVNCNQNVGTYRGASTCREHGNGHQCIVKENIYNHPQQAPPANTD